MKTTEYFLLNRTKPDREWIEDEWIDRTVEAPDWERVQLDGRYQRWKEIPEANNRFLRVVVLPDGETVHNAFFDRRFKIPAGRNGK